METRSLGSERSTRHSGSALGVLRGDCIRSFGGLPHPHRPDQKRVTSSVPEQLGIHVLPRCPQQAALGHDHVLEIEIAIVNLAQSRLVPISPGMANVLFSNPLARHEKAMEDAILGRLAWIVNREDEQEVGTAMHHVTCGIDDARRVADKLLIAIESIDRFASRAGFFDKGGRQAARVRASILLRQRETIGEDAQVQGIQPKRLLREGADTKDRLRGKAGANAHEGSHADAGQFGG